MTKPAPLAARTQLRASGTTDGTEFLAFEGFTLDLSGHALIDAEGREVPLTRREFQLLSALLAQPGRVNSREHLLRTIDRKTDDVFDRSIDVAIWRLRRKIEAVPSEPRLIKTVPGAGYKFAAVVERGRASRNNNAGSASKDRQRARQSKVERRHVTVLSCELVGLTALASTLDPEELRVLVAKLLDACTEIVSVSGASMGELSGDCVDVYFGYPRAHEHDAEQAVRAGLKIVSAIDRITSEVAVEVHARVGISSGLVVIGDFTGGNAVPETIGETPLLAAKLRAGSPLGAVLVARATRELVGGLFEYREIDLGVLGNSPLPLIAWRVLGESIVESRFSALREKSHSPIVGREVEMERLLRLWKQASAGAGRTALICGMPGIGKSRLARWLADRVEAEQCETMFFQCSPSHIGSPLHPVLACIERTADMTERDSAELRLEKLERMLVESGLSLRPAAPLLAQFLSIPVGPRYPLLALPAAQLRQRMFDVLVDLVASHARRRPILLVFEDVHWADSTSLELIDFVFRAYRRMPIMLLITSREDTKTLWSAAPAVSTLALDRLGSSFVRALIKGIACGRQFASCEVERIVERADGIPLYVEELTKLAVEETAFVSQLDTPLRSGTIPATLHDALMSRIDCLGAGKKVAQAGAVIGREFTRDLVCRVTELDGPALTSAIADLEASDLVSCSGTPPDVSYSFVHALLQEAAHNTLSARQKQDLHARIAKSLVDVASPLATTGPELIAHHFTEAGQNQQAAEWWGKAGERAFGQTANVEATSHYERALALAQELTPGLEQQRLLLQLQVAYARVLNSAVGPAVPRTSEAFFRARDLAVGIESPIERLSAIAGLWGGSLLRADLDQMRDMAEHFMRAAETLTGLSGSTVFAKRLPGQIAFFVGDYSRARIHLEDAVTAYEKLERHNYDRSLYTEDPGVAAMCYLAVVLRTLGRARESHRWIERACVLAVETSHAPTIGYALVFQCALACLEGDPRACEAPARSIAELCNRFGFPLWRVPTVFCTGWTKWHAGERETGLVEMREAVELCQEQGTLYMPNYIFHLAECEGLSGQVESAITRVTGQLVQTDRSNQRWLDAELRRRHAELLLLRQPADFSEAETAYLNALETAREQQAIVFELRAAVGLANLYSGQSRAHEAHRVLTPILEKWNGDSDLPELQDAKRLLLTLG